MDRFPPYHGLECDRKISNPDNPNFWKYGVANLIFLDHIRDKRLLLDLGCGTGGSTFFLAEHGKAEWIIGVDVVKDMIRVAKKNAINRGLDQKICFLICDGRYLPFKASCFEALISRGDAFCFLIPLKSTAQELKRVMKPKGVVILEMDNRADWKIGTIVSTGFQKKPDGKITYLVETFTTKRNHRAISYILDPNGEIAKKVSSDSEFQERLQSMGILPSKGVQIFVLFMELKNDENKPKNEMLCLWSLEQYSSKQDFPRTTLFRA